MRFLPLGGLGEVGMNCLAICAGRDAILVDAGVTFDDRQWGVDVYRPDFGALHTLGLHVHGLVLTHGHEDHIGAVPYFLREWDVPVCGPRYALALLDRRRNEHDVLGSADLREVFPRQPFRLGPFEIEPIRVTHSIADATALAVRSPDALALHTGDFKFDDDPMDGETFDVERIAELGREGIDVLLSDSTNADVAGTSRGERSVYAPLLAHISEATGAVFVGLFASNVHRLKVLGKIAEQTGRKLILAGRSMGMHANVARDQRMLSWPSGLVVSPDQASAVPRDRWLVLATGSQGEPASAFSRIADGSHPHLAVMPGDTVIFSSRVIPGNERIVAERVDEFLRRGAHVVTGRQDRAIHVSGHACIDEQTRMIELAGPRSFVPIHGTLALMHAHARIARAKGVAETVVTENGMAVGYEGGKLRAAESFDSGRVAVAYGRDIPEDVLYEREELALRGVISVSFSNDSLRVDMLGVSAGLRGDELCHALRQEIARAYQAGDATTEDAIRLLCRRIAQKQLGYRPEVLVHLSR
ncbi:MAG: ribonuclease J [Polyangiaceae bacterium]